MKIWAKQKQVYKIMKQKILTLASLFLIVVFSTSCIFMGPSVKGNGKVVEEGGPELADKLEAQGYAEYVGS